MRILPILCGLALYGCDGGSSSKPDRNTDTADTDTPGGPNAEADCEDGADNDGDGLADCEDSDCAAAFVCTWPDSMQHTTDIFFDGYSIECDAGIWGTYDYDVDDCSTIMTAPITVTTDGELCTQCDRTYVGPFTVTEDSCDELSGDEHRPSEGRFGFVFISETERELWSQDEQGTWAPAITMTSTDGTWSYSDSGEVDVDYDECENSPLTIGMLSVSLTFVDQ